MTDETTAQETAREATAGDETASPAPVNEEAVRDALRTVFDPEIGINIVELGLIYEIAVEAGKARVTHTLTTPACPVGPMIRAQIEQAVNTLDGIDEVEIELVFSPPWDPKEMCSDEAKFELGIF